MKYHQRGFSRFLDSVKNHPAKVVTHSNNSGSQWKEKYKPSLNWKTHTADKRGSLAQERNTQPTYKTFEHFHDLCTLALHKYLPPAQSSFTTPDLVMMIRRCDHTFHPKNYGVGNVRQLVDSCKFLAKARGLLHVVRDQTRRHAPITTDSHTWSYVEDIAPLSRRRRNDSIRRGENIMSRLANPTSMRSGKQERHDPISFGASHDPVPEHDTVRGKTWLRDY